ncbi:MAG TPA: VOC family protein, partial [Anaeromyxobacter sp.]|nr:VOC family protein [Anaeromyxobacter sp.]
MPLPFHHLAVQCADLEGCERFYREVLGLPVLRRWPREGGGDRSVWLATGEGG